MTNNQVIFESVSQLDAHLLSYNQHVVILTDENIHRLYPQLFDHFPTITIPAGENQKRLAVIESIVEKLIALNADRGSLLIGVGGGVICDICGLVGSLYMRGITFAYVPTTLLAQVDAAYGGKTGVNIHKLKNIIGTFQQPIFTWVDIRFVNTLAHDEFINGCVESIKHACIEDVDYFSFIDSHWESILHKDIELVEELVKKSVGIKSKYITADPMEKNVRKLLNYGHTFGHAIEKTNQIAHGYAVAQGILLINQIGVKLGVTPLKSAQKIESLLQKIGIAPIVNQYDKKEIFELVKSDKKKNREHIDLILLQDIGKAEIHKIHLQDLENVVESL